MAHRRAGRRALARQAGAASRPVRRGNRWWWVMTLGLVSGLLLYLFRHF
jgi:hypothetical protein